MRLIILFRGLPGNGKTTVKKQVEKLLIEQGWTVEPLLPLQNQEGIKVTKVKLP